VCSSLSPNPSAFHFLCRSILLWFCGPHWFSRGRVFLLIHFLSAAIFLVCSESFLLSSASAGIFVYATRVLCADPFFITKVPRSRIPVPMSRCVERFTDLYFLFDFQSSYSSNRSKHLVDSVHSSVSLASRPVRLFSRSDSLQQGDTFVCCRVPGYGSHRHGTLSQFCLSRFFYRPVELMSRSGAHVLGLGLHARLNRHGTLSQFCLRQFFYSV
jgi:hypothetical protein